MGVEKSQKFSYRHPKYIHFEAAPAPSPKKMRSNNEYRPELGVVEYNASNNIYVLRLNQLEKVGGDLKVSKIGFLRYVVVIYYFFYKKCLGPNSL